MKKWMVCAILLMTWTCPAWAGEKGWFGFQVKVHGDGFFLNPTLRAVVVESITPNSPAAQKSIAVGDEIVQVEDTPIAGRKANELKPLMQKQVGESLHLKIKRPKGETYSVTLVAIKSPG